MKLDGQPKTTPTSFVGVVGQVRELQAVTPQSLGGVTYEFKNWSDAGDATHSISTPSVDTTYTVNNTIVPNAPITFDNSNNILCSAATCPVSLDIALGSDRVVVVAIEDEHDIWPDELQILGIFGEALVAGFLVNPIPGEAHVAEADVHAFQLALQNRLNPRVVLHPVGETIAVNGDHVIWLEAKWSGGSCRPDRQHRGQNANDQQKR